MSDHKQYETNPAIKNQFILVGNRGGEFRKHVSEKTGEVFYTFSVAEDRSYLDKEKGEYVTPENPQWHSFIVYNPKAQSYLRDIGNNARVRIKGKILQEVKETTDPVTGQIRKEYRTNLIANYIELAPLPKKEDATALVPMPHGNEAQEIPVMA